MKKINYILIYILKKKKTNPAQFNNKTKGLLLNYSQISKNLSSMIFTNRLCQCLQKYL
jgi:hypothetical protein